MPSFHFLLVFLVFLLFEISAFLFPVFPPFLQSYHFDRKKFCAPLVALPPVLSPPPHFWGDEAVILTVPIKDLFGVLLGTLAPFSAPLH